MSRLTRDGTAEPVSRHQILRRERGQGNIHFPCSADHEQDWQLHPFDPYACSICDDRTMSRYSGKLLNYFSKPNSIIMLEKNNVSVMMSAATTSSPSIVDSAVGLWRSTLKLMGPLASATIDEKVELPFSGLLPPFASE